MVKKRKFKRLRRPILSIWVCLFAFLTVSISTPAKAAIWYYPPITLSDPNFIAAYTPSMPIIDGIFEQNLWNLRDPAAKSFTTTGGVSGAIGFLFDENNLYIAVRVFEDQSDSPYDEALDKVLLYFDNDNDGGVPCPSYPTMTCPEAGDDIFGYDGSPYYPYTAGFSDGYSAGTFVWTKDEDEEGGTSDGDAAFNIVNGDSQYEIVHPLDSDDDAHDFSLALGDTVGIGLRLTVDGVDAGWWPYSDPSSWGKIVIPVFYDDFTHDAPGSPPELGDPIEQTEDNAMGTISLQTYTIPVFDHSVLTRSAGHGFSGNYVELYHGAPSVDYGIGFRAEPAGGPHNSGVYTIVWEMAAYLDASNAGRVTISGNSISPCSIRYKNDNTISFYNWFFQETLAVGTYSADTPQKFKIVIDFEAGDNGDLGRLDLYIDNMVTPAVSDQYFDPSSFTQIDQLFFGVQTIVAGNQQTTLLESYGIDNIKIYPGGSLYVVPDPTDVGACDDYGGDTDGDGICNDGDGSGYVGDSPCIGGEVDDCDDNCVDVANPLQEDSDYDGIGDLCDPCPDDFFNDEDNDGICAGDGFNSPKTGDQDNCPTIANSDQVNNDTDSYGDACDNCPYTDNDDSDGDGIADTCIPTSSSTTLNETTVQLCFTNDTGEPMKILYPNCHQMTFIGDDGTANPIFPTLSISSGPYMFQEPNSIELPNSIPDYPEKPLRGDLVFVQPGVEVCVECDYTDYFYTDETTGTEAPPLQSITASLTMDAKDPDIVNGDCTSDAGCNEDIWWGTIKFGTVQLDKITVEVDIKPGAFPNSINLGSKGKLPVGILGSAFFDVMTIDPTQCSVGGTSTIIKVKGKSGPSPMASYEDLNGDGFVDLLIHVETEDFSIEEGASTAICTCITDEGFTVEGTDEILIVKE